MNPAMTETSFSLSLQVSLPVDTRAVPPGLPQAAGGVHIVAIAAVGQERVDAVESVGPVQMPPAAGWM